MKVNWLLCIVLILGQTEAFRVGRRSTRHLSRTHHQHSNKLVGSNSDQLLRSSPPLRTGSGDVIPLHLTTSCVSGIRSSGKKLLLSVSPVARIGLLIFATLIGYFVHQKQDGQSAIEEVPDSFRSLILPPSSWVFKRSEQRGAFATMVPEMVPDDCSPLICFVHTKAGGAQGVALEKELKGILHPFQVVDVSNTDPEAILRVFAPLRNYRVLVCGGDGTVGWILKTIRKVHASLGRLGNIPPVSILPIGTGNDLSIELGWGRRYCATSQRSRSATAGPGTRQGAGAGTGPGAVRASLRRVLENVIHARRVPIDLWSVMVDGKPCPEMDTFQNYLGIGIDASITMRYATLRKRRPYLFFNRWINKSYYAFMGFVEMLLRSFPRFSEQVQILVDDKPLVLPPRTKGIVVLNIKNYAGGSQMWYDDDSNEVDGNKINSAIIDRSVATPLSVGSNMHHHHHHHHHHHSMEHELGDTTEEEEGKISSSKNRHHKNYLPASISDGLFEVVAVQGPLELGRLKLSRKQCVRKIAQGSRLTVQLLEDIPIQADGEPWMQPAHSTLTVERGMMGTSSSSSSSSTGSAVARSYMLKPLKSMNDELYKRKTTTGKKIRGHHSSSSSSSSYPGEGRIIDSNELSTFNRQPSSINNVNEDGFEMYNVNEGLFQSREIFQ